MTGSPATGADLLVATLEDLGVQVVFGVPGTQTVGLFEALRRGSVRTVLTTHELGAAFMANGYARASGRVGVIVTIPGPGFAYALPGLGEARADSAALLHLTLLPAQSPRQRFMLQHLDQEAIAAPLVKAVFDVETAGRVAAMVREAHALAASGEPGPVLLQLSESALRESAEPGGGPAIGTAPARDLAPFDQVAGRLAAARRPVLLAGQGACDASADLVRLVERLAIPVLTTPSGRGVIPEDHPWALGFEPLRGDVACLNELLESADLILTLGCKLAHNGTVGFAMRLPPQRVVQVNTDPGALGATYGASLTLEASAEALVAHLLEAPGLRERAASVWAATEVGEWRRRLQVPASGAMPEPSFRGTPGGTAASFFAALRRVLPRDGILVTDSGLHQVMARRHFTVLAPRGLIAPTDFQSMGFGIPAAVGAKLAAPGRRVAAVVGDGGLLMTGMELATAAREGIAVTVIVFNDGSLSQIRLQQLSECGREHAVRLRTPSLEALAEAVGVSYFRLADDPEAVLRAAIQADGPALVEVEVGDGTAIRRVRAQGYAKAVARGLGAKRVAGWLRGLWGLVRS